MNVEIIGALTVMAIAAMVLVATLFGAHRHRPGSPASPALSASDQRLLPYMRLTPAQWLALTDLQRASLRERAYRAMN